METNRVNILALIPNEKKNNIILYENDNPIKEKVISPNELDPRDGEAERYLFPLSNNRLLAAIRENKDPQVFLYIIYVDKEDFKIIDIKIKVYSIHSPFVKDINLDLFIINDKSSLDAENNINIVSFADDEPKILRKTSYFNIIFPYSLDGKYIDRAAYLGFVNYKNPTIRLVDSKDHESKIITPFEEVEWNYPIGWIITDNTHIYIYKDNENLYIINKSNIKIIQKVELTIYDIFDMEDVDKGILRARVFATEGMLVIGCSIVIGDIVYISIIRLFAKDDNILIDFDIERYIISDLTWNIDDFKYPLYDENILFEVDIKQIDNIGFLLELYYYWAEIINPEEEDDESLIEEKKESRWYYQSRTENISYRGIGSSPVMNHEVYKLLRKQNIEQSINIYNPLKNIVTEYV